MPELPEVEYIARQLRAELIGRRIEAVQVLWLRTLGGLTAEEFAARVVGHTVRTVGRRAKYLLLTLDDDQTLIVHRRMSGNLVFLEGEEHDPYTRVCFQLDDGRRLVYTDPRKFGRVLLVWPEALAQVFEHIGPEPLEAAFTPEVLAERLAGRQRPIKAVLLDQTVIAGLGNIYADEALWQARIHPLRVAATLTTDEVAALRDAIQAVLATGIEHGGTTFGRHRDVYNEAGRNLEHVQVYQHTGQPCLRCGTPIARLRVAQRSTHYCPHCQRLAQG